MYKLHDFIREKKITINEIILSASDRDEEIFYLIVSEARGENETEFPLTQAIKRIIRKQRGISN